MKRTLLFSLLITALTLGVALPVLSQTEAPAAPEAASSLRFMGRVKEGKVQLRWIPTSAAVWRTANRHGYILERAEMSDAGAAAGFSRITLLKPFANPVADEDDYVRAAKEVMQEKRPAKPGVDAMLTARNDEQGDFFTFVLATNLSVKAATAATTLYEDATALPSKTYAYRLYIPAAGGAPIDTALLFVDAAQSTYVPPVPAGLRVEEEDSLIRLFWNHPENRKTFAAYFVERSKDGGKSFERLTKNPVLFTVKGADEVAWVDSFVTNYVSYQYRISGITAFGDEGGFSVPVRAMSRDKTPPAPVGKVAGTGDERGVRLTWELPTAAPDLKGVIVARGPGAAGPFHDLTTTPLSPQTRTFADARPSKREAYYHVYTVDTSGNRGATFPILAAITDSIPPKQPTGLAGTIDSFGRVHLRWNANSDDDVDGYHVYVANARDNVYRQFGGEAMDSTTFTDSVTMRDLNRSIFYKVTAVDYNNNPSPYSEVLELKRPDVHAPVAPVISDYSVLDGTVRLEWVPSSSKDVARQQLVRREGSVEKMLKIAPGATSYTDAEVEIGKTYAYFLRAADSTRHVTSSRELIVTVSSDAPREGVETLKAKWEADEGSAVINWRYKADEKPQQFVLYRGKEEASLKAYRKIKEGSKYADSNVSEGEWFYAMKVLYADGGESTLSEPVKVQVK